MKVNNSTGSAMVFNWNLLLDMEGGPNHKNNFCKAPILRNEEEIIKTPIFHYLKHVELLGQL